MAGTHYYNDQYAKQDHLNFEDFASAIFEIIEGAETPMTIGVFGSWGSGKTTLLRMLEEKVENKGLSSSRSVWFTAWKYDNQEAIWRSFILRVLNELYYVDGNGAKLKFEKLSENQKVVHQKLDRLIESVYQPVNWQEEGAFHVNSTAAGLALAKMPASLLLHVVGQGSLAEKWGMNPDFADVIAKESQKYFLNQLEFIEQFESTFKQILTERFGENGRLVVFIDDLDRCMPEKAVVILEAIKLFLNVEGTVFVLGMDRDVICRGIEARYQILFKEKNNNENELPISGDSYLQKLIQIPFSLPPMDETGMREYYQQLESKKRLELDDLTLGVFTCGVLPNPRQAKRVLNIFTLLRKTAENRNIRLQKPFEYSWPLLAKTVLIQTQWPELYKLWRQDPVLIQTFQRALLSQKYSEDEFRLGRKKEALDEETESEDDKGERTGSDGILSEQLEKLWKDRRLRNLLLFPASEGEESVRPEDAQKANFLEIKTYSEMMGYLALAGTIDQKSESVAGPLAIDEDIMSMLMSNDRLKINEAVQRIQEGDNPEDAKKSYQNQLIEQMTSAVLPARERASAGNGLAVLGDPRFLEDLFYLPDDDMLGFVEIPEGHFLMGSDPSVDKAADKDERPQHKLRLPTYYMAKYPVTVAQWQNYLKLSGHQPVSRRSLDGISNHPVVVVTWHEALAFCQWLDQALRKLSKIPQPIKNLLDQGWSIGLPSEAEWEKAARGTDGRIYPYGTQFNPQKGNVGETGIGTTSPVGCFSGGALPDGCEEMSGNVWEWTRSIYDHEKYPYPYQPDDGREALDGSGGRVLRGGAFDLVGGDTRCAFRFGHNPDYWNLDLGFRVVLLPKRS